MMNLLAPFRRDRSILIVGLGLLLTTAGCGSSDQKGPASRSVDSVSVSAPKGRGFGETWEAILSEWSARTGVSQSLTEIDAEPSVGQPLPADLNLIPLTSAVEFASRGELKTIPTLATDESGLDWQGIFQGLREKACSLSGQRTLMPISSPVFVLYYRADLLAKAGRKPPETWDDYLKLLQDLPQWGGELKAVEPWEGGWGATMYLARAAAYAKHPNHTAFLFDLESGDPMIDSAGFQKAWEINQEILKHLAPEVKQYTPYDCRREILEGKAALAIALESPGFARATRDDLEALVGAKRAEGIQLGFIQLPGSTESFNPTLKSWEKPRDVGINRVSLTGFDGLCAVVSSQATDEGALLAWNLLQTLTLDDTALLPAGIPSPVRESDLTLPETFAGQALEPIERGEYLSVVGHTLRNRQLVLEMPVIGRDKFLAGLTEVVQQGLSQPDLSGADFTKSVGEKWAEVENTLGKDAVRDSCRVSHGMRIPTKPAGGTK